MNICIKMKIEKAFVSRISAQIWFPWLLEYSKFVKYIKLEISCDNFYNLRNSFSKRRRIA